MGFYNFYTDVAVDLGTANTLVYVKGQGIVLSEASIVAYDRSTEKVLAIGNDALTMHEKTHKNIETVRPLKDGVIADFEMAEQLIRGLTRKVQTGVDQNHSPDGDLHPQRNYGGRKNVPSGIVLSMSVHGKFT